MIYLFSTRVDLSFAVHKLENFPENPGKVHFEGLVHLLRYIRDNKKIKKVYQGQQYFGPELPCRSK